MNPKLIIVSDNHGDADALDIVYRRHENEEAIFVHCGDSELAYDHAVLTPFQRVSGNCDGDTRFPEELVFEVRHVRVYVVHGHLQGVHNSPYRLTLRAEEQEADIVCFGHTHRPTSFFHHGKIFINPGSLRLPRGRIEKTYASVLFDREKVCVRFLDDKGQDVPDLRADYRLNG